MAADAIIAAGLAVSAYSTYSQNQNSQQANALAKRTVSDQESAQGKADAELAKNEQTNQTRQSQDAQWMQLKTMQNNASQNQNAAPYSLTAAGAGSGAAAGANAGKLK